MELLGLSGYIFASIAYFLFILLLLAARNRTVSGALVLLGSLVTLASFTAGAFQLEQHFSIKIIFVLENIKFLFWSLIILATRERIQTINDLFINKYIRQYFLVWMAISFVTWFSVIYLQSAAKLLFMLFLCHFGSVDWGTAAFRSSSVNS